MQWSRRERDKVQGNKENVQKKKKKGQTNFSSVQHNPLEEKYHWKSNI